MVCEFGQEFIAGGIVHLSVITKVTGHGAEGNHQLQLLFVHTGKNVVQSHILGIQNGTEPRHLLVPDLAVCQQTGTVDDTGDLAQLLTDLFHGGRQLFTAVDIAGIVANGAAGLLQGAEGVEHIPLIQNGLGLLFDGTERTFVAFCLEAAGDQRLHFLQIRDLCRFFIVHMLRFDGGAAQNGYLTGSLLHQRHQALGGNTAAAAGDHDHIVLCVGTAVFLDPGIGEHTGAGPTLAIIGTADLRPIVMDGKLISQQLRHFTGGHIRLEVDQLHRGLLTEFDGQRLGNTVEGAVGIMLAFTGKAHFAVQEGGKEYQTLPLRLQLPDVDGIVLDQIDGGHGMIVGALILILRIIGIGSKGHAGDGAFFGNVGNQRLRLVFGKVLLQPLDAQTLGGEEFCHGIGVGIFLAQQQHPAEGGDHALSRPDTHPLLALNLEAADGLGIGQIQIVDHRIVNTPGGADRGSGGMLHQSCQRLLGVHQLFKNSDFAVAKGGSLFENLICDADSGQESQPLFLRLPENLQTFKLRVIVSVIHKGSPYTSADR